MQNDSNVKKQQGFTLLELMVTVAIIAIIAAIAIPSYLDYTKKSHYSELVRATAPYKLGVVQCFNATGNFAQCSSGTTSANGIPPSILTPPNEISSIGKITVDKGTIIAEPNPVHGLTADEQYILTPTANNGVVSWTASGKAVEEGLTK